MKNYYEIHIKLFNGTVEKYSQPKEKYVSKEEALEDFGIGINETVIYCEQI
tara:strand:+ start:1117 stop:1269 length:153 start_codon:yes stop_codon:yes gene_type:complete